MKRIWMHQILQQWIRHHPLTSTKKIIKIPQQRPNSNRPKKDNPRSQKGNSSKTRSGRIIKAPKWSQEQNLNQELEFKEGGVTFCRNH